MSRLRRRLRLGLPEHSTRHLLDDIRKGTPDGLSPHLSFSSARSAGPRNYGLKTSDGQRWRRLVTTNVRAFVSAPLLRSPSTLPIPCEWHHRDTLLRAPFVGPAILPYRISQVRRHSRQCATRNSVTDSKMLFGKWACSSMTPIALRLSTSRTPCGIGKSISVDPHLRARNRSPFRPRSASGGPRSMRLDPTRARKTFTCNLLGGGSRLGLHAGGRG